MTLPPTTTAFRFAVDHHSILTTEDLTALGVDSGDRRGLVRNGSLTVVARGLYQCFEASGPLVEIRKATAHLAGSAASHRSGLFLVDFDRREPERHEISAPSHSTGRSPFARVRRTTHLPAIDVVEIEHLPCTSMARTVCDMIPELSMRKSEELVAHALSNGVDSGEIIACDASLARRGRSGVVKRRERLALILPALSDHDLTFLETTFELRYHGLGLVDLEAQFRPPWFDGWRGIVDFACPARKLIIELDGRSHRERLANFQNDRQRDRRAARQGFVVLRFTFEEVMHRWSEMAEDLRAHLSVY